MVKKVIFFVFIICVGFNLLSTYSLDNEISWEGSWNTTFKKLVLKQSGNRVSGTYGHDNGRIVGIVSGSVLQGTWYEAGNQTGKLRFVMSLDGKSFSGKWGNNSNVPGSTWNGTRLTSVIFDTNRKPVNKGNSEFFNNTAWTGTWNTTFKKMVLAQTGSYENRYNKVSGTYGHDNGKIVGIVNGNVLEGTWHEAGNQTGKFRFVMSLDGKSFSGKWGSSSNVPGNTWNGTRITRIMHAPVKRPSSFNKKTLWEGSWNTTFKKLVLKQNGNKVSGTYGHDNGRIVGIVNGNVLEGTWHEAGNQTGKFRFVISLDGKSFSGKWGNNSNVPGSTWNGTKN